jgi:chloramphenicol-sensitive protein RarD
MGEAAKGIWAMVAACTIWGLSPMFYALLSHIPPLEVLAHRSLWSLLAFALVLAAQRRLGEVPRAMSDWRAFGLVLLAAAAISLNWFLFIHAVASGRTVEASLGYYIFPFVAVAIGAIVLREPLGLWQGIAVSLAALAVAILTWGLGVAPWISLALAVSFGIYGLLKRWVMAGPVVSVTAEVLVFLPFALGYLAWIGAAGHFGDRLGESLLLIASGPLTATPLILFSYAAKRARMTTIGLLQYLNPTLQFGVAVLVLMEPISQWHLIAFPLIWLALALYSAATLRATRPAAP